MVVDPRDDAQESVRHLAELGYVDPQETVSRQVALRSRLETDLRGALELMAQGRRSEAAATLEGLAADDPEWVAPRQFLAELHYRGGNFPAARQHLDWLAHHGVVSPRLAAIEGALAIARRDWREAVEELRYAAHVEPALPGIQTRLGSALARLADWTAAEDAFREAVRQKPADAAALDGLAAVELQRGDYEAAAHWALEALTHDVHRTCAHYRLGIALAHLDRPDAAMEAFATAARLEPTRAAPYFWLSRIAGQKLGDAARAAEYRTQARHIIRQRRRRTTAIETDAR